MAKRRGEGGETCAGHAEIIGRGNPSTVRNARFNLNVLQRAGYNGANCVRKSGTPAKKSGFAAPAPPKCARKPGRDSAVEVPTDAETMCEVASMTRHTDGRKIAEWICTARPKVCKQKLPNLRIKPTKGAQTRRNCAKKTRRFESDAWGGSFIIKCRVRLFPPRAIRQKHGAARMRTALQS